MRGTLRVMFKTPGAMDAWAYVASLGPIGAEGIVEVNTRQADEQGCEPTLDVSLVRSVLPLFGQWGIAQDAGDGAWVPTALGFRYDQWLTQS